MIMAKKEQLHIVKFPISRVKYDLIAIPGILKYTAIGNVTTVQEKYTSGYMHTITGVKLLFNLFFKTVIARPKY